MEVPSGGDPKPLKTTQSLHNKHKTSVSGSEKWQLQLYIVWLDALLFQVAGTQ